MGNVTKNELASILNKEGVMDLLMDLLVKVEDEGEETLEENLTELWLWFGEYVLRAKNGKYYY